MMPTIMTVAVLLAAAGLCAGLIVALHPLLRRYALARPNARSSHREPTPQGGGGAVITATLAVAGIALAFVEPGLSWSRLSILAAAVSGLAAVGAVDDLRPMPVGPRLALQALAAGLALAALPDGMRILPALPAWIELAALLIGLLWIVNLTNFMDGIDWMTVAEVAPVSAGLALLGVLAGLPTAAVVLSLALCGAILGFAPFNRPVARLFLGDVGSLPIGLLLGWLLIMLASAGHLAAALILPMYYAADATLTLLARLAARDRVWEAHRRHAYQRAVDGGMSAIAVVRRVFLVNVVLVVVATGSVFIPGLLADAGAIVAAALVVGWLLHDLRRAHR